MKTNLLIIIGCLPILFSCNRPCEFTANLILVYDNVQHRNCWNPDTVDQKESGSGTKPVNTRIQTVRILALCYKMVNHYCDSILIPFDYAFHPEISVRIQGKDSVMSNTARRFIGTRNKGKVIFAPNDTILMSFTTALYSNFSDDDKWLENAGIGEILPRMQVNVNFAEDEARYIDLTIPQISFTNDTDNVTVNPPLIMNKTYPAKTCLLNSPSNNTRKIDKIMKLFFTFGGEVL